MNMDIVKSIGSSDIEIVKDLIRLHSSQDFIDLDPTYSKGIFYKNNPEMEPRIKSDLYPKTDEVIESAFTNLDFIDNDSLGVIVFDPPFVISGKTFKDNKEGSSVIAKRFHGYMSWDDIKESYYIALAEFNRKLREGGLLLFKCQDTVSSGKNHMTHVYVMNAAVELGFYPKDLIIKEAKSKMTSFGGKWKTQQHAMKYHSYWWAFEKKKSRVDYECYKDV